MRVALGVALVGLFVVSVSVATEVNERERLRWAEAFAAKLADPKAPCPVAWHE